MVPGGVTADNDATDGHSIFHFKCWVFGLEVSDMMIKKVSRYLFKHIFMIQLLCSERILGDNLRSQYLGIKIK